MNPDFAIVLNFKLKNAKDVDADFLVKTARNIGARVIAADANIPDFKKACAKYTISLIEKPTQGTDLTATDVIDRLVLNRKAGAKTIINVPVTEDGKLAPETELMLKQINNWMHIFGHAFNESEPCTLKVGNVAEDSCFILQNRHAKYQKYIFVKTPLPETIKIIGLTAKPNRIELIDQRTELEFEFSNNELTIDLTNSNKNDYDWQIIRIQEHRPEDDIKETKF
ncbi:MULTISPECIES: hypothetical protein [Lactobacillus]|uniref:hypothetical protein n=1 Tax=Lactobacillus TaxID=1578 RepID=UPI000D6F5404|nr:MULTISPECIES: hypothetical protein [Lactobacillus]AWN32897.1 hypothetical protein DLD54_01340 [Lactobacillus helsingborgensis]RMC54529.1 hypothetical protein F5ESL0262_01330 [Lactobacillus sp. ESL0262]